MIKFTFEPKKESRVLTVRNTLNRRGTLNKDIRCLDCQNHINISYLPQYLSTSFIIYECYLTCHSANTQDFCGFISLLYVCHLDNVTVGYKLLWHLCNAGIQPSARLFSLNKQVSSLLNTQTLIIHMELNGTLFIKATALGDLVLCAYTPMCACSMRKQEGE